MNDAENANDVEESIDDLEQSIQDSMKEQTEEPAPQLDKDPEVEKPEAEEKPIDGFQKRINKVTEDKWNEKRRADELQAKLDKLEAKTEAPKLSEAPSIDDFDDDDEYQSAVIDYKVEKKAEELRSKQIESENQERVKQTVQNFQEKANELRAEREDFDDVINRIPTLQPDVLMAVMSAENAPELALHLGENLDIADRISRLPPVAAGIELGKISTKLSAPKPIEISKAPEPIETLDASGSLNKSIDDMSMDEIMNL